MFGFYKASEFQQETARPASDIVASLERIGTPVSAPWRTRRGNAPVWRRRTRTSFVFSNKREDAVTPAEYFRPYAAVVVRVRTQAEGTVVAGRYRAARLIPCLRILALSPFLIGGFIWVGQPMRPAAWVASFLSVLILFLLGRNTRQGQQWYEGRVHQLERALSPALFDPRVKRADELRDWLDGER